MYTSCAVISGSRESGCCIIGGRVGVAVIIGCWVSAMIVDGVFSTVSCSAARSCTVPNMTIIEIALTNAYLAMRFIEIFLILNRLLGCISCQYSSARPIGILARWDKSVAVCKIRQ